MKRKQRLRGLVPCTSHPADLSPLESYTKPTVLDFGFKLEQQIGDVVESSIFHFRQMAKVKPAAVRKGDPSSHLGYMIVMHFFGIRQSSLKSFHLVQSAVAHLLTGASKTERITPTLAFLHWLPVHVRLHFKIIVFVCKSLYCLNPSYLSELFHPYALAWCLRSADQMLLEVPMTRCNLREDRAFSVATPFPWNNLPLNVWLSPSVSILKTQLKTHLYSLTFSPTRDWQCSVDLWHLLYIC